MVPSSARIVFRCDASDELGLGHLSRCLNLADALAERGARSCFVMRRLEKDYTSFPFERGHEALVLETEGGADDSSTREACAGADWLVLDMYGVSSLHALKGAARKLCVLDDRGESDLQLADRVVNPTPDAALLPFLRGADSSLLLGPSHALLHRAFAARRPSSLADRLGRKSNSPRRLFLSMGGTDAAGLTFSIAAALFERIPHLEICAVVPTSRADDSFSIPAACRDRFRSFIRQTPEEMAAHMEWADLAVSTPSTLSFELSCLGVPAVFLQVAPNQERIADALERLDVARVYRNFASLEGAIASWIQEPSTRFEERRLRFSELCDGRGAERVAESILRDCYFPVGPDAEPSERESEWKSS